jgi:murein L,D-transpeptidase YafK
MLAEIILALSLSASDVADLDSNCFKTRVAAVERINKAITKKNVDEKLKSLVEAYKKSKSLEQRLLLESAMKYAYAIKWWESIKDDAYNQEDAVIELEEGFERWKRLEGLNRMEGLDD